MHQESIHVSYFNLKILSGSVSFSYKYRNKVLFGQAKLVQENNHFMKLIFIFFSRILKIPNTALIRVHIFRFNSENPELENAPFSS